MASKGEIASRIIAGVASGVLEGVMLILVPKIVIDAIASYAGEIPLEGGDLSIMSLLTSGYFIVFVMLKTLNRLFQDTVLEPVTSTLTYLYVVVVLYSILNGGIVEATVELEAYTVWMRLDFSPIIGAFLALLVVVPAFASIGDYVYSVSKRQAT